MEKIRLSVIIASYNSAQTIGRCLDSLQNQMDSDDVEVIVVDSSSDGTAQIVSERFPKVRLFAFSERRYPGDARNFGVSKARSTLLAFTDADCLVGPGWINEVLEAHRMKHPLIGGVVDNGNPESSVGWGYYFCEFSQWMPGSPQCRMVEIPTCCLSMKRWLFDEYGPFLEGTYCSDTAFQWKSGRDGYEPLLLPAIKVSHVTSSSLIPFLTHESIHGKNFAEVRAAQQGISRLWRTSFLLASPLLPFLLFYRNAKRVLKNRIYLRQFLLSFPLVFLGLAAWSYGEFLGYLGRSRKRSP